MTTNIFGLSNYELEQMRLDAERLMPDSGTIYTLSRTSDGMGGWTEGWTASGTAVCRLDGYRGNENLLAASSRPDHSYMLTLPWDTTVTTNNKVTIGSYSFLVKSVDHQKSMPITRRVFVERI